MEIQLVCARSIHVVLGSLRRGRARCRCHPASAARCRASVIGAAAGSIHAYRGAVLFAQFNVVALLSRGAILEPGRGRAARRGGWVVLAQVAACRAPLACRCADACAAAIIARVLARARSVASLADNRIARRALGTLRDNSGA